MNKFILLDEQSGEKFGTLVFRNPVYKLDLEKEITKYTELWRELENPPTLVEYIVNKLQANYDVEFTTSEEDNIIYI